MEPYKYLNIPEEDLKEIEKALDTLDKKLLPHLTKLTNEERRFMPKMGDRNFSFVNNAISYAKSDPALRPPYINMKDLTNQRKAVNTLRRFFFTIEPVRNGLVDSIIFAGSHLLKNSLLIYDYMKSAKRAKIFGAREAYEKLRNNYPGRGPSKEIQGNNQ
ncbi:MAG: hypothetical protein V5A59_14870 [Bacteroidales bacterium]